MAPASVSNVLYPAKPGAKFDMAYYLETHMPLVQKHWAQHGLIGWTVVELNEGPYSVQAILEWKEDGNWVTAKESETGKVVFGDIPNFSSESPVACAGGLKASWSG